VPATRITVRLTPRGGRDDIERWDGDVLRVRVSAAPVDDKANAALLRLLAKTLRVPPSTLSIASGAASRTKIIEIEGLSLDEVHARLLPLREVPEDERWKQLRLEDAPAVFERLGCLWWIAGGWAIDLFAGRETRAHSDIDVAMLRRDHMLLHHLMPEREIFIAHDGSLAPWDGASLDPSRRQFWVRGRGDDAWEFELLLEQSDDDAWVYRRDGRVSMPLASFGRTTATGLPFVSPAVALLYKAASPREHDEADFNTAAPLLDAADRRWLRDTLRTVHPGSAWIERL
jgi:uncharacterized protein YggU (UPF0235/DUF167 family)